MGQRCSREVFHIVRRSRLRSHVNRSSLVITRVLRGVVHPNPNPPPLVLQQELRGVLILFSRTGRKLNFEWWLHRI